MRTKELTALFANLVGCEVTPEVEKAVRRAKRLLSAGPEVAIAAILLGMTNISVSEEDEEIAVNSTRLAHAPVDSVDGDVVSEAEQIRRLLTESPNLTNKQVIHKLGETGVDVTSGQVTIARKQLAAHA